MWYFGTRLEQVFSTFRILVACVLLAVFSSTAEYAAGQSGIGLSGVVYGLFTLSWVAARQTPQLAGLVDAKLVAIFVAWFFFCILTTYADLMQVGNIAHSSGAALGIPLGFAIAARQSRTRQFAWAGVLSAVLITAAAAPSIHFYSFRATADTEWIHHEAQRLHDAGRGDDAIALLRSLEERHAANATTAQLLGSFYTSQEAWPEATEAYRNATERAPAHGRSWFLLADALGRSGELTDSQWTDAVAALRESVRLDGLEPSDVEIAANWAAAWGNQAYALSAFEQAISLYQLAVKLEPDKDLYVSNLEAIEVLYEQSRTVGEHRAGS